MAEFISYEDNLFFVMAQSKHLQNGLRLTLSRTIFGNYYKDQFRFLSDLIEKIQEELLNRPQLIRLNDYLQMLRSAQASLLGLFDLFLDQGILVSDSSEISDMRMGLYENYRAVLEQLSENEKSITEVDTVSSEEMSILLSEESSS